jgi:O-methyltransferase
VSINHSTSDGRLQNMHRFIELAPPGIIIEVGVWQGGSLRYLAERHSDRTFFGFDTFSGMPEVGPLDNFHNAGDFGDTSFEMVSGALADLPNVTLVRGLFPESDITGSQPIAMVHVDVDIYRSTLDAFRHLAPRIVSGGRIYCDDAFQHTCEGATLALCQFATETHRVPQFDLGSHAAFCF